MLKFGLFVPRYGPKWLLAAAAVTLCAGAPAAQGQRVLAASGSWAAIDRGAACEAGSLALGRADKDRARAGLAFDRPGGRRHGEFHAYLSRSPRAGASVLLTVGGQPFLLVSSGRWAWSRGPAQDSAIIAAIRSARSMRIESRDSSGRRIIDRYLLAGAPVAIDAAAIGCASTPR